MGKKKIISIVAIFLMTVALLCGCGKSEEKISLEKAQSIAEIATMKAYYHNVAELSESKNKGWYNIINVGYKKMWLEYTGIVEIGIDASKLEISEPDSDGTVKIKIPKANILGNPDIIEDSMKKPLTETGWFTDITAEDQTDTLTEAQETMRRTAETDEDLLNQAQNRAEDLIENYIKNVGNALGKEYTIEWEQIEG